MVDLSQLLDPKRAEREEGWHNFAQSYERSMAALTDALKKLAGKRKLEEGESAFTVLEAYIAEQRNKAELDREKAARLHDMVSSSIPEVTAEQKAAYESQKKLYDQYQDELKKQTDAVKASADAQVAAIDREEKKKIDLLNAQAAQLKREKGGDITKSLAAMTDAGESAAKSGGKDTIASLLMAGAKDFLGKKQAEREGLIDEVVELRREEIKSETAARRAAIAEESKARIQAIEKEVRAQAALAGVEKAPKAPEEARAELVAKTEKALIENKHFMAASAAAQPVARSQREALQAELRQEAIEEQSGEYLAPAVVEDMLPGVAAPAPVFNEATAVAEPDKETAPITTLEDTAAEPGGESRAAGAALPGDVAKSLASVAEGVNAIVPTVAGVALPLALGARALTDIDDALPLATSALAAIGEGSKLLGPIILSAALELGGYLAEGIANIVEVIQEVSSPFSTRREKLEESGELDRARAEAEAKKQKKEGDIGDAANSAISKSYSGVSATLRRVEPTYTTPADERERTKAAESLSLNDEAVREAVAAMLTAQEQAFKRQAELGQGAVPLQLSVPSIENFNM